MKPRVPTARYLDPVDQIWLNAARRMGLRVVRTQDAYARTEGRTLHIGEDGLLDPDDCLAQMVLHEICHSLVEGPDSFDQADWGLDNAGERDVPREHACLRAQAWLTMPYGLREVLAPTTDFRGFYDSLGVDPLGDRTEESSSLAILAVSRAATAPWAPHLGSALAATGEIARQTSAAAPGPQGPSPSLWSLTTDPLPHHPSGQFVHPNPEARCGSCAWRSAAGSCTRAELLPVAVETPGCARWETEFDCQGCGACCRAAYHSVTIGEDEPAVTRYPDLVVHRDTYVEMRRSGDRCIALRGSLSEGFGCSIYADRPTPCREFERGGDHCATARRRLGLSL